MRESNDILEAVQEEAGEETAVFVVEEEISGQEGVAAAPPKADLQAGEKAFTMILFLLGLFFFVQSLMLLGKIGEGQVSASAAALPLFTSGIWTLFTLVILIENIKRTTPLSKLASFGEALKKGLEYAFPTQVAVMLGAIVLYCGALLLGISFYIVTPLFLWGTMSYLTRKGYLKNILWTAICMAFVILVFQLLFGVIMP